MMVTLLDYGAGNVRSIRNAIRKLGYDVKDVSSPKDVENASKLIFPGVGSFGNAMKTLYQSGYVEALRRYVENGKPFFGICLGLQTLFEGSEESPGVPGLGVIKGYVRRFDDHSVSIPHIGWNGIKLWKASRLFSGYIGEKLYFVHSYRPVPDRSESEWILTTTDYGGEFVSGVQKGNVVAVQFHPEKSGSAGLQILKNFLESDNMLFAEARYQVSSRKTRLTKRIVACLDVRTDDEGNLVVTKGHRYDVREKGEVRRLGEPVELAKIYFEEGADEICFLNITGFRNFPLKDMPMLEVLRKTSENVFVPLTIGGGIRDYVDSDGRKYSSLDVASEYFRSGADKVSIGSEAVYDAEKLITTGEKTGENSIEQISEVYGRQAVVVSIDPRRVYVQSPNSVRHHTIKTTQLGPNGEEYCWYQCTVKGGREERDIDAFQMAKACEKLGAGEILLNCIDRDGTNLGYDIELIRAITHAVGIPVIASSGAGCAEHFYDVFTQTDAEAALAAGIFHRKETSVQAVKNHLRKRGIEVR